MWDLINGKFLRIIIDVYFSGLVVFYVKVDEFNELVVYFIFVYLLLNY